MGILTANSYWDETRDAGKFSSSPVFDKNLGFGGTGQGTGACVQDGPFANLVVNIGPGFKSQARCVNRQITDFMSGGITKAEAENAIAGSSYDEAWLKIYSGLHLIGHIALSMMVSLLKLRMLPLGPALLTVYTT